MEDLTVVYFCMDKEGCGKKRCRGKWQYRIEETKEPYLPKEMGEVKVQHPKTGTKDQEPPVRYITVWLPPYVCRKKPWKAAELLDYLRGLMIPKEDSRTYYLYEKEAGILLGRQTEPLPTDWLLFMTERCMAEQYLSGEDMKEKHMPVQNALVILQDRNMEAERLVEKYVQSVRYIGVVTKNCGEWELMQEVLSEEYGFLLDVVSDVRFLCIPPESKVLWITGRELYGITPVRLTPNSVWLSTDISVEEGKRICARGKNILYRDVRSGLIPFRA